jgi:UDP-2-acetamido-3-amino-2,3-dideoxy-glucuronate N-acetyltransferase
MKLAVIGAGYWGAHLVRNFASLGVLDSICDLNSSRAAAIAFKYGARSASSYDEILYDDSIQAVVVATPAATHYSLARQALLAGKDVFVEKPMTLCTSHSSELINLAERDQRVLMVGHLLKYHPAVLKLKEIIDAGELGEIQYIYSNRLNLGKVRREENALWSFAPHDISVILYLLGDRVPLEVVATGGNYLQRNIADVTVSSMLFENGIRAHIFVSWLHPYKEQKLVVIGSRAMAAFDDLAPSDKLRVFSRNIEEKNGDFLVHQPVLRALPYRQSEPLREECTHFISCVRNRSTPLSDGYDGLRVSLVLER